MPRARDLGIRIGDLEPGPLDAITDVAGTRVGHTTIVEGDDVRTGVTVVIPGELPAFAGTHRLNGNGELTGLEWVRESGLLTTPIGLTNTFSVGVVRDAIVAAQDAKGVGEWHLPVVGETYDGVLNDISGMHVRPEHVHAALEAASGGPVEEGAVGSGTGMICHGFKGGIGTASRVTDDGYSSACSSRRTTGAAAGCSIDGVGGRARARRRQGPAPTASRPGGRVDHRAGGDGRAAAPAPVRPGGVARRLRRSAHGRSRRELERRPGPRLVDRERDRRRGDAARDDACERADRPGLLRGDRRHRGGDRERAARRRDDDRQATVQRPIGSTTIS